MPFCASLRRFFTDSPARLLVLAFCLWRILAFIGPVYPHHVWLRLIDGPATALCAAICAVFTVLKKRSAVVWAIFAFLFDMLYASRFNLTEAPFVLIPLFGWLVVIALLHKTIPATPLPPSRLRDLKYGLLTTVGLFLFLEGAAAMLINTKFQAIYDAPAPVMSSPIEAVPTLPTIATIGSSPANLERIYDRPFSLILAERFQGRVNFLFSRAGGLHSDRLVKIAKDLMASETPPDALILYVGHQDLNASRGVAFLEHLNFLESNQHFLGAVKVLVRQSALVRLALFLLWQNRYGHVASASPEWIQQVYERYRKNMDEIVSEAERRGIHVFASTVQAYKARVSEQSRQYMALENSYIRELPRRFSNVTLVDFEPVLDALYPDGPKPDCEPFEYNPLSGECGDPYHLGPKGHEILADTLAPAIEKWLETTNKR